MKTLSISSSRRRALSPKREVQQHKLVIETCPECGHKAIARITNDYLTEMGFLIPDLERFHCNSCGAEFFDSEAMTRIVNEGRLAAKPSRRTTMKKTAEPNHA